MRVDGGDNNDGITIVDVTNPKEPRYCFAVINDYYFGESSDADENNSGDQGHEEIIPSETPLEPQTYLWMYDHESHVDRQFDAYALIDKTSLQAIWEGREIDRNEKDAGSSSSNQSETAVSLKSLAVSKVLHTALEQPELQMDAVAEVLDLPETRTALKEKLYDLAESNNLKASPAVIELLSVVLGENNDVDLGPFRSFKSSDLCTVIVKLQDHRNVTSVNLSNNIRINETDLLYVLNSQFSLQTIHLLGESSISRKGIQALVRSPKSSIRKVYHAKLFRQPFTFEPEDGNAQFTEWVERLATTGHHMTQNILAWAIWVSIDGASSKAVQCNEQGGRIINWQGIANYISKNESQLRVPRDLGVLYGTYPLHDTNLSPIQVINALLNVRRFVEYEELWQMFPCFAQAVGAASSNMNIDSHEISPFPTALYAASTLAGTSCSAPWALEMPYMEPGQWTLLLVGENMYFRSIHLEEDSNRESIPEDDIVRYALISPITDDVYTTAHQYRTRFKVIDMESFLSITMDSSTPEAKQEMDQNIAYWREKGKPLMDICSAEEVHNVIPIIEKSVMQNREGEEARKIYRLCYGKGLAT